MAVAMLKSASAPRLINLDWSNGRPAATRAAPNGSGRGPAPDQGSHGLPPHGRALRPAPPAWRACRADMPRMHFLCLAGGWAGAALALLGTVLLIRVLS